MSGYNILLGYGGGVNTSAGQVGFNDDTPGTNKTFTLPPFNTIKFEMWGGGGAGGGGDHNIAVNGGAGTQSNILIPTVYQSTSTTNTWPSNAVPTYFGDFIDANGNGFVGGYVSLTYDMGISNNGNAGGIKLGVDNFYQNGVLLPGKVATLLPTYATFIKNTYQIYLFDANQSRTNPWNIAPSDYLGVGSTIPYVLYGPNNPNGAGYFPNMFVKMSINGTPTQYYGDPFAPYGMGSGKSFNYYTYTGDTLTVTVYFSAGIGPYNFYNSNQFYSIATINLPITTITSVPYNNISVVAGGGGGGTGGNNNGTKTGTGGGGGSTSGTLPVGTLQLVNGKSGTNAVDGSPGYGGEAGNAPGTAGNPGSTGGAGGAPGGGGGGGGYDNGAAPGGGKKSGGGSVKDSAGGGGGGGGGYASLSFVKGQIPQRSTITYSVGDRGIAGPAEYPGGSGARGKFKITWT